MVLFSGDEFGRLSGSVVEGDIRLNAVPPWRGRGVMHRQIAGKLTGRVTKWIVLVAWIVIMGASSGFAQKLAEVQNNEASSWLPSSAESTKALEKLAPFQDQNDIPTTLVYVRDGGLTQADLAAIKAQVPKIQAMDGVVGTVVAPDPAVPGSISEDGAVA